jgi:hypothetical protein
MSDFFKTVNRISVPYQNDAIIIPSERLPWCALDFQYDITNNWIYCQKAKQRGGKQIKDVKHLVCPIAHFLTVSIIPMFRIQLCEFEASEFRFRGLKNGTAKGKRPFVQPTGVEHDLFHGVFAVKLQHFLELFPMPACHNALNDRGFVLLQIDRLDTNIPKQGRAQG